MKKHLENVFNSQEIQIIGRKVPGAIGIFEVEIEGKKLLHSKKNGNGFVDSESKMEKIVVGIQNELNQIKIQQSE